MRAPIFYDKSASRGFERILAGVQVPTREYFRLPMHWYCVRQAHVMRFNALEQAFSCSLDFVGVAFVNLSLGFRLSNRNQTLLQGFTFLYQYQRLSKYSQVCMLEAFVLRSYYLMAAKASLRVCIAGVVLQSCSGIPPCWFHTSCGFVL